MSADEEKKFIRIDVGGKSPTQWAKIRSKFLEKLDQLLDQVIDPVSKTTVREEGNEFIHKALSYAKEKLRNPGLENERIVAEIHQMLSAKKKDEAEARKLNAEAAQIEFNEAVRRMKFFLMTNKVLLLKEKNQEAMIFVEEIDDLIRILGEFSQ